MINTLEPTLSAELIATLGVGAILAALIVAQWYDTRRNFDALRAEVRAESQGLREDFRDGIRSLRTEFRADVQGSRQEVRGDFADLRSDIQALTVRMARIEGFLVGYFAERGPRDRRDDAA